MSPRQIHRCHPDRYTDVTQTDIPKHKVNAIIQSPTDVKAANKSMYEEEKNAVFIVSERDVFVHHHTIIRN